MRWGKAGWLWLCLLSVGCATATPQAEPSCFSCDDQRVVRIVPRRSFGRTIRGGDFSIR
jgi:hypothetical protein